MSFEQRPADVGVQRVGEEIVQDCYPRIHVVVLRRFLGCADEQVDEPRQAVLVHRVDQCEVGDAEEQN